MTNNTIKLQNAIPKKVLEKYRGAPYVDGSQPGKNGTYVPITTPNFPDNRDPKGTDLADYIKKSDGFHWGLYGSPLVAELPSGERVIYDGGHRVAMLQSFYPEITEFPCTVIQVSSMEEVNRLFYKINGFSSKNVTSELRFINQIKGQENMPHHDKMITVLEKTGLVVAENEDNFVPVKNKNFRFKMNVGPLQKMVYDARNVDNAIWALNLYKKAWDYDTTKVVTGQIAEGLWQLKCTYSDYKHWDLFENWLVGAVSFNSSKRDWLFTERYPHDRMEKRFLGTALGIMEMFIANTNKKSPGKTPKLALIESLYKEHVEKRSKKLSKVA